MTGRVVWGIVDAVIEKSLSEELAFEQRLESHDMQHLMEESPGRGLSKCKDPRHENKLVIK